jgi:hypothetical protein
VACSPAAMNPGRAGLVSAERTIAPVQRRLVTGLTAAEQERRAGLLTACADKSPGRITDGRRLRSRIDRLALSGCREDDRWLNLAQMPLPIRGPGI